MRKCFPVMKQLGDYTRVKPEKRATRLEEFVAKVNNTRSKLDEWKISLDPKPLQLPGRLFPAEILKFGEENYVQVGPQGLLRSINYL